MVLVQPSWRITNVVLFTTASPVTQTRLKYEYRGFVLISSAFPATPGDMERVVVVIVVVGAAL